MENFQAVMASKQNGQVSTEIKTLHLTDLPEDEVLIQIAYSGINYKDGLASQANSGIVGRYPIILGIDLSGIVIASKNERFEPGQKVIVTSYGLGTEHFGGLSEYACIPADWIVPLPENLSLKEAMIIGTAGFTAALSIFKLQQAGLQEKNEKVLVTGATGGVGSMSIAMLHQLGFDNITASSRKETQAAYLKKIGTNHFYLADDLILEKPKPLAEQKWSFIIDPVGGSQLTHLLPQVQYLGAIALSGNTAGIKFDATVLPFILRGVQLIGIDSVFCPMPLRQNIWQLIATTYKPTDLMSMINQTISLQEVPNALTKILNGQMVGRTLVEISNL